MKIMLNWLYKIFLMSYLEPEKYYEELCDKTEKECEIIAKNYINLENKT
jgi:hypothetical protein